MKILKNTLIVSSYVLLVALFFGGGYAIGRIGVSDSVPTPMPTVAAVEEVNANDVKTTVYEVKVENGLLQINKCVGDNKTAILSAKFSMATAVGLFQSLVGLVLVLLSDRIAKILGEEGLL